MANYALSVKAARDIETIAVNSLQEWGFARAEKYVLELHAAFQRLAEFPDMGREVGYIRAGYMRMQTASHSVFYRKTENGIPIVRVLHQGMNVARHL